MPLKGVLKMSDRVDSEQPGGRKRRELTDEFRRDAVRLIDEERYTFAAAAKAVGVSLRTMHNWHEKFSPPPEPCGEDASVEQLQAENQCLRKQLRQAELEREILKKATAYFAKESQ